MTRYIDAKKIELRFNGYYDEDDEVLVPMSELKKAIAMTPTADVVEVIRCKDCIHRDPEDKKCDGVFCAKNGLLPMDDNDYCSYGAKMDEEE